MKTIFKPLIFFAFLTFLTLSCTKPEDRVNCSLGDYGTITLSNNSSNPYDFYIDNKFITTVNGNTITAKIHIKTGSGHKLHVKQVSGYIFSPNEEDKVLDVEQCADYTWQIP